MKKILFYTADGVGLGHLRRVQLIAENLKKEGVKIILATSSLFPQAFGKFYDDLVILKPFSDRLNRNEKAYEESIISNEKKMFWAIKKFNPNILVCDFHLSKANFTFLPLRKVLDSFKIRSVFIWRLDSIKNFPLNIITLKKRLKYFDKIILPYSQKEFKFFLPSLFFKKIQKQQKFKLTGPIFKEINRNKVSQIKEKYFISKKNFNLLLTFGAGGKLAGYCESPKGVVSKFLSFYPLLKEKIPNLRSIVVTGPYSGTYAHNKFKGLTLTRFEKNLPELIKMSDLVISSAGYNTCNEIMNSDTPAIIIPLQRAGNEQFERGYFLKKRKKICIINKLSKRELIKEILRFKSKLTGTKKYSHDLIKLRSGENKATEVILNELNEN